MAKRSFWAWGMEADEPTSEQMKIAAKELASRYKVDLTPVSPPKGSDLSLRKPRIIPPSSLAAICAFDDHDRAVHTYGRSFRDRIRAFDLDFPNPQMRLPDHEANRKWKLCWNGALLLATRLFRLAVEAPPWQGLSLLKARRKS
ncbi:MAG: hypothetical protein Ct9H300mP11_21790 [Chloroflexota bacterium]|nr:MAG: hypothetical protein Ct9H300mP11_21790 [Chloroflexota bacterium]